MTTLAAAGIVVKRGGRTILDRASTTFASPGLTVVVGPNGAGKSTLLSTLAGLLKPDAGDVRLDGAPILQMNLRQLALRRAYLPQNARSEWPITVERVVALGLSPTLSTLGAGGPDHDTRIEAMLAACDLTALRDQPATTLSGGELARTMLGRAMIGDPDILIVDEPIAGLDPRHGMDAMRRLRALGDAGRIVIVAVHDLALAARYGVRVIAVKEGRVIADGPCDDVFTATLLSDLFDVQVRVVQDDDGLSIRYVNV
jgi:iron complex transport system ATP-binding protein